MVEPKRCHGTGSHEPFENLDAGGCGCCPDCCGMDFDLDEYPDSTLRTELKEADLW